MDFERTKQALEGVLRELPPTPRIDRVEVSPYEDMRGEEALRVWVILDEGVSDREIETADYWTIEERMTSKLRAEGVDLFPYFSFVRESDYETVKRSG